MTTHPGQHHSAPDSWRDQPFLAWRAATYTVLLMLAAVAWQTSAQRMQGMGADSGELGFFLITWVVMMAAMMFPSVAPMVATYVTLHRGRRTRHLPAPSGATALFVLGYLVAWTTAGLVSFAVIGAGERWGGEAVSWERGGRWLAVGVLLAAAGYEATPWKNLCLTKCRGPMAFLLHHWRPGLGGALRMGTVHGGWCIGCCWGLMAALAALGTMNLTWMVLVAVLIAAEKLLPWRRVAVVGVATVLVLLAAAVALAPMMLPDRMA